MTRRLRNQPIQRQRVRLIAVFAIFLILNFIAAPSRAASVALDFPPTVIRPGNTYALTAKYSAAENNSPIRIWLVDQNWNIVAAGSWTYVKAGDGTHTNEVTVPSNVVAKDNYIWAAQIYDSSWRSHWESFASVAVVRDDAPFVSLKNPTTVLKAGNTYTVTTEHLATSDNMQIRVGLLDGAGNSVVLNGPIHVSKGQGSNVSYLTVPFNASAKNDYSWSVTAYDAAGVEQANSRVSNVTVVQENTVERPPGDWRLVWSDEFDGTYGAPADVSKWAYFNGWGGYFWGQAVTTASDAHHDGNGHLVFKVRKSDGKYFTSYLTTKGIYQPTYGYFEMRCSFSELQARGAWPSFFLYRDDAMAYDGIPGNGMEIDVMEYPWMNDQYSVAQHWGPGQYDSAYVVSPTSLRSGYHTFGLLWTPNEYVWYLNGKEVWRRKNAISNTPLFLILSEEVRPDWGVGNINDNAHLLPDTWSVDYVRVYKLAGTDLNDGKEPMTFASAPYSVAKGQNVSVTVNYSAPGTNSPLRAALVDQKWNTVVSSDWVYVSGTGQHTFQLTIPSGAAAGDRNIWISEIYRPDWSKVDRQARIENVVINDGR